MRARRSIIGRSVALMLGGLVLAGCSSVPDAVNPVEWYKGARDMVTGKDDSKPVATTDNRLSAEADQPPPGADEPVPSVNSVPARPKVSSADERDKVASALVSDQQGARRYSGEVIKRQGEIAAAAPPPRPAAAAPVPAVPVPTPSAPPPAAQLPTPSQQAAAAASSSPAPSAAPAAGPTADQVAAAAPTPPPPVGGSAPPPAPAAAPSAPRTPPQMREVAAAAPVPPPPAPGQPIRPSNIVIPRDNPTAPKMNEVKPYTPPPGSAEDYDTVYVTGAPGQGGESRAPGPRRSLAAAAATGAQANAAPAASSRESYQVATIQFANGSSRLSESDRRILAQVEAQHRQVGGTLRVVGHTAGRAESDDQTVSQARADVVAAELERLGAKADQVRTAAVGDSQPKYAESSPNGIAGNRRTEIFIDF